MSFLDKSVLEDMQRNPSNLKLYEKIVEFIGTVRIRGINENNIEDMDKYRQMLSDSMYSIVSKYSNENTKEEFIYKFSKLTEIEIIEKDNVNYSGLTQHYDKNKHCKISVNKNFCENDWEMLRTITHELLHVSSNNEYLLDGLECHNLGLGEQLGSINEIMTVFFENEITNEYYDKSSYKQEDCTNCYLLNTQGFIHFSNDLRGYDDISEYAKFIYILNNDNVEDLYFKRIVDNIEYLEMLQSFQDDYKSLNFSLDNLRQNRGFSNCFSREDSYLKANNEICKIIKEKIDNGITLKEYLEFTIRIQEDVRMNIGMVNDNGNSIINNTLRIMDTYYLVNELKKNKEEYKDYISKEMYNLLESPDNILERYIYDVLREGEASSNICSRFGLLRSEEISSRHTYLKNLEEERLIPYFFEAFKNTKKLPLEGYVNNFDIKDKQLEFNYLTFTNGQSKSERIFKNNLDSTYRDFEIVRDKIKIESFKYRTSKVFSFIEYDKRMLINFIKNCSDDIYFEKIITELNNTNPELFNELLNSKIKVFGWDEENQTLQKETTPLQYALDNLQYNKFMTMANLSNGTFEKPELFNIYYVCDNYGKLLNTYDIYEKPELSKNLKDKGYETFFDLIKISPTLDENDEINKSKDIRYIKQNEDAIFALIEEDYFRPSEELEKNLEKLTELGYNELLKDIKFHKEFIDTLCLYHKYDILYNHLEDNDSNKSSLVFLPDDRKKTEIINNYIIDNPQKFEEVESKYKIKYDYVLRNSIDKSNFKIMEDILLNEQRCKEIPVYLKILAFENLTNSNKISLSNKVYELIEKDLIEGKDIYSEYPRQEMLEILIKTNSTKLMSFIESQNISFEESLYTICNKLHINKEHFSNDELYNFYKTFDALEKNDEKKMSNNYEMVFKMSLIEKDQMVIDILKEKNPNEIFGEDINKANILIDSILKYRHEDDILSDVLKNIKDDYNKQDICENNGINDTICDKITIDF